MLDIDTARRLLADVVPPDGRADLTNPQKIALAQAIAAVEIADQLRAANLMTAVDGATRIEVDRKPPTPAAADRQRWRNAAREVVQGILGARVWMHASSDGS